MKGLINSLYWQLIPAALVAAVISVVLTFIAEEYDNGFMVFLAITTPSFILTYLNGLVLKRIQIPKFPIRKIALWSVGIALLIILPSFLMGLVSAMIYDYEPTNAAVIGGTFFVLFRAYYVKQFSLTKDTLTTVFTIILGLCAGFLFYVIVDSRLLPRRFMGEFPLNLLVGYGLAVLCFNLTLILPALQNSRKVIMFIAVISLIALCVDLGLAM